MNRDDKKGETTFSGEGDEREEHAMPYTGPRLVVRHVTRLEANALRQRRPYCRHCFFSDGRHAGSCVRPR